VHACAFSGEPSARGGALDKPKIADKKAYEVCIQACEAVMIMSKLNSDAAHEGSWTLCVRMHMCCFCKHTYVFHNRIVSLAIGGEGGGVSTPLVQHTLCASGRGERMQVTVLNKSAFSSSGGQQGSERIAWPLADPLNMVQSCMVVFGASNACNEPTKGPYPLPSKAESHLLKACTCMQ
jgi:hypothetical protein